MSEAFLLDSCAVIAFANGEPGDNVVEDVLQKGESGDAVVKMHKLNLLEVYYDTLRRNGEGYARKVIDRISNSPIEVISELSDPVFKEAGRLKASHKISLADAIALAEASVQNAALVTCDHHEFDIIEKTEPIRFKWIR
jgi:predicted nucleic acid-binding protein